MSKKTQKSLADQLQDQYYDNINDLLSELKTEQDKQRRLEEQQQAKYQILYGKLRGKDLYLAKEKRMEQQFIVPVDGDITMGSKVFSDNCMSCHTLQASSVSSKQFGPALGLIYNRKVGSDKHFTNYSSQVLKCEQYWSGINLYKFLGNPNSMFKFSHCGVMTKPLISQSKRADLLTFLNEYSKQLSTSMKIQSIKKQGYDAYQTQVFSLNKLANARPQKK